MNLCLAPLLKVIIYAYNTCMTNGLSDQWTIGTIDCLTKGLSKPNGIIWLLDKWVFSPRGGWTSGLSDHVVVGPICVGANGLLYQQITGSISFGTNGGLCAHCI